MPDCPQKKALNALQLKLAEAPVEEEVQVEEEEP